MPHGGASPGAGGPRPAPGREVLVPDTPSVPPPGEPARPFFFPRHSGLVLQWGQGALPGQILPPEAINPSQGGPTVAEKDIENAQTGPGSTAERLRRRKAEQRRKGDAGGKDDGLTFLQRLRGYADALVFAFVLAMFIRSFVFELFMIPTGSMTPTLIGDSSGEVAFLDYDGDGVPDVVYTMRAAPGRDSFLDYLQIYLMNEDNTIKDQIFLLNVDRNIPRQLAAQSSRRKDMIIVNKFAYWFRLPERGDVAVFKVPNRPERNSPFDPTKPVYIKRVVGLPGETIDFPPAESRLVGINDPARHGNRLGGTELHLNTRPIEVDGEPHDWGDLSYLMHFPRPEGHIRYPPPNAPFRAPDSEPVGPAEVLLVGDNAASSSDGRYWGAVPLDHLRGRAVLRYFPLDAFGFLK